MTSLLKEQEAVDKANKEFWNELCGSGLAKQLGITDHSLESLKLFDDTYMSYYPYLLEHVKTKEMKGKKVLDVGLGFGTLGQIIARSGADYTGLDIAEGPVKMLNHRLRMLNLPGLAIQGSMLECPIESSSMDWVVSIGCFHHTGNMQRCVDEAFRVLKPGGRAMIMVYNRFSLRQWQQWPRKTWQAFLYDNGLAKRLPDSDEDQRRAYDAGDAGEGGGAPETEFFSKKQIHHIFQRYSMVKCHLENSDDVYLKMPFRKKKIHIARSKALPTFGKLLGLDIYIEARK